MLPLYAVAVWPINPGGRVPVVEDVTSSHTGAPLDRSAYHKSDRYLKNTENKSSENIDQHSTINSFEVANKRLRLYNALDIIFQG